MNILVTGANGQLGNEIRVVSKNYPQHQFLFTDVAELDICNRAAVETFVKEQQVNYILNCAAYTAVDKAEDEESICRKINADAPENLGVAAQKYHCGLIHISTDYVFDGTSCLPYTEAMEACPASAYGRTKREGEIKLQAVCPHAIILRTAWLYSNFGNNFVKTMLRLGRERDSLGVIFDQIGTPTYAADLAKTMVYIADQFHQDASKAGIYHFTNEGVCSWYDFTLKIHELGGITRCVVRPLESSEYPAKAPRPHYSVLNKKKIRETFHLHIPHWEDGLKRMMAAEQ